MSEPTADQIAAFRGLFMPYMEAFMKLPADVQEKYNNEEAAYAGKPKEEMPDYIKSMEIFGEADVNKDGMLDLAEWKDFQKKTDEFNKVKYGAVVEQSDEDLTKWWEFLKALSPGEGVTKADLDVSMKLYEIVGAEMA